MTSFDTQPIDEYSNALKFQLDADAQKIFKALFPLAGIPSVAAGTLLDGIAPLLTPQTLYLLSDIDEQLDRCFRHMLGKLDTAQYFDLMISTGVSLAGPDTWDNPLRRSGVFSDVEVQLRQETSIRIGEWLHGSLADELPEFETMRATLPELREYLDRTLDADIWQQLSSLRGDPFLKGTLRNAEYNVFYFLFNGIPYNPADTLNNLHFDLRYTWTDLP